MHEPAHKLRAKIAANQAVLGTMMVEFGGPAIVGVTADAGFDFLVLDCEHGNANPRDVEVTLEAGFQNGICTIIRPPSVVDRGMMTRSLDAGAGGVLIPFCSTLDDVRHAVLATKYPPTGQRGVHLLRSHTRHRRPDAASFMAEANRDLITVIQIELAPAVRLVDEIAGMDGVDVLYIGPGDLSVALGAPGQWNAPPVMDAIGRTAEACRKHGKIMGCHVNRIVDVPDLMNLGVRMFGYSCDIAMYQSAAQNVVSEFTGLFKAR
jgi:2-keto-3-deoxy-L-rhamnonate aldolase RhmA